VADRIKRHGYIFELHAQETLDHHAIGLVEPNYLVKPPPDSRVQRPIEISSGYQETLGSDPINEDKQAVNNPAQLVVLAAVVTRARQSVELIEEENADLLPRKLEDFSDVGCGLA